MMQKKNNGVTLVEVLIALAVFLLLMTPLVNSIVLSIKSTDDANELQNRNDYAEYLMETVKNASINDLQDSAKIANYFDGSETVNYTAGSGDDFEIEGTTYLGPQKEKYSYKIKAEPINSVDGTGIMSDLDPNKAAFIPVTFSNYDDVASEAIIAKNIESAHDGNPKDYRKNAIKRIVKVTVSSSDVSGVKNYQVECSITYKEDKNTDAKEIKYELYKQDFSSGIPNIYIMYNSGICNDLQTTDEIEYDLSGVAFAKNEKINAFIIRTAEDYNKITDDFKNSDNPQVELDKFKTLFTGDLNKNLEPDKKLYKSVTGLNRNDSSKLTISVNSAVDNEHFMIYQNLNDGSNNYYTEGSNVNNRIESLDKAHDQKWNTYDIKIWLQKGDKVDDKAELITLEGTRGGGKFE